MPKKYKFTEKQIAEIDLAFKASKDIRESNRLQALRLRMIFDMPIDQISKVVMLSESYINRLISFYDNKGISAITAKPQGGNHRLLTYEQESEILKEFQESAMQGEQVSAKEIEKKYIEVVGKNVGNSQIYYVLKRHKWRIVKPRKKHPQADPIEQEAYKKNSLQDKRYTQRG